MEIFEMKGKTIQSIETIQAEYGRTYNTYICIVFTDNTKILLHGGIPYDPKPNIEDMKKAYNFFTVEDISKEVERLELKRRQRIEDEKRSKKEQILRLQRELEENN